MRASDGTALGWAAYSPESQIRARMWTFDPDAPVDAEFVARAGRAPRPHGERALLSTGGTDSARLVFSEADGVPGLIADRYGDTVVCQLTTAGADAWRDVLADALFALPGVACVYERSDADVREREGLVPRIGLLRGADAVARPGGPRGRLPLRGRRGGRPQDGLLPRPARRPARGGRAGPPAGAVLNVFRYTGAFSVIAAARGAASVLSIDSSGPALAVAARNGALNGVDVGELMEADAFTALRGLRDRAQQYDLICSTRRSWPTPRSSWTRRPAPTRTSTCWRVKLLAPGGVLMTWSCSGAMSMDLFQKVVAGAALDASAAPCASSVACTSPSDHPVPLAFPEAEYLKGLVLHAD